MCPEKKQAVKQTYRKMMMGGLVRENILASHFLQEVSLSAVIAGNSSHQNEIEWKVSSEVSKWVQLRQNGSRKIEWEWAIHFVATGAQQS